MALEKIISYSMSMSTRILIADDEGINRLFIKTVLAGNGWEVEEAANGRTALELVEQNPFDAVILDVKMPVMDGKQAAGKIRALEQELGRRACILLGLTAYAEKELIDELMRLGMDGVIHKPITQDSLVQKLNQMLDERD